MCTSDLSILRWKLLARMKCIEDSFRASLEVDPIKALWEQIGVDLCMQYDKLKYTAVWTLD